MQIKWFLIFGMLLLLSALVVLWWYNLEYQPGRCSCVITVQGQKVKTCWQAEDAQSCMNACQKKVEEIQRSGKKVDEWKMRYNYKTIFGSTWKSHWQREIT